MNAIVRFTKLPVDPRPFVPDKSRSLDRPSKASGGSSASPSASTASPVAACHALPQAHPPRWGGSERRLVEGANALLCAVDGGLDAGLVLANDEPRHLASDLPRGRDGVGRRRHERVALGLEEDERLGACARRGREGAGRRARESCARRRREHGEHGAKSRGKRRPDGGWPATPRIASLWTAWEDAGLRYTTRRHQANTPARLPLPCSSWSTRSSRSSRSAGSRGRVDWARLQTRWEGSWGDREAAEQLRVKLSRLKFVTPHLTLLVLSAGRHRSCDSSDSMACQ